MVLKPVIAYETETYRAQRPIAYTNWPTLDPLHHPTEAIWTEDGEAHVIGEEVLGTGLAHEAAEVMRCLRNGEIESPLVPLEDSLAIMHLMDLVREKIGLSYPVDDLS